MADRYWVGGTGTWDASSTSNWSATSGGAAGASAPTLNDNTFFDVNSDSGTGFTVTIGTGAVCADITVSGLDQVMTLAGSAAWSIHGSLTYPITNLNRTYTGAVAFRATTAGKTITTNGVTLTTGATTFNGVGGVWTLGSALTLGGTFTLSAGTFDTSTSNYSLICTSFARTGGTFTVNNSTISVTGSSPTFDGSGLTYYDVVFTNTGLINVTIIGQNTYNNLTFTSRSSFGIASINLWTNQTVNGTLTLGTANTPIRRVFVSSANFGTQRTINAANVASLNDVDFRDIAFSTPQSGIRLGDCGGNNNITFDAPKTVYRVDTGSWTDTQWALTSGGSVNINNFPLAQDTAIFDVNTAAGTYTNITTSWNVGTIDTSLLSGAVSYNTNYTGFKVYKNLILSNQITFSNIGNWDFLRRNATQYITSSGKVFADLITINTIAGRVILNDNLTVSSPQRNFLYSGTLDLNNNVLSVDSLDSFGAFSFGTSGKIILRGNNKTIFNSAAARNHTGNSLIECTYSGGSGTRTIVYGTTTASETEARAMNFSITAGSDTVSLSTSFFKAVNFTGFTGTLSNTAYKVYGNLLYSAGMTLGSGANTVSLKGTIGTQNITTNGKTIDFPVTQEGLGGTVQLADNFLMGTTRNYTLTAGTLNLNNKTFTCSTFSSSNSNIRSIAFGTSAQLNCNAFTATTATNLTTTGTGVINMQSASPKTFAGGGAAYPKINQGGAGALTITGANSFLDITNTVQPATVTLPSTVTTNVQKFSLNGTVGNLITLNASTLGTRATLNKTTGGAIFSPYLSIRDSAATPAQIWFAGTTSTNAGNNTGWVFADLAITTETATITDTNTAIGTFNIAVTENETLTDVYTGQAVIPASRNESTALTSSTASQAVFALSQTDTQTVSDSSTGNAEYPNIATESLTMSDSMQTTILMQVTVDESTTLTESQSAIFFFAGVVAELMQVSETQTSIAIYTNAHNESITITDQQTSFGWFTITDQQTSFGWFTINTIQNPNWTVINDTQV